MASCRATSLPVISCRARESERHLETVSVSVSAKQREKDQDFGGFGCSGRPSGGILPVGCWFEVGEVGFRFTPRRFDAIGGRGIQIPPFSPLLHFRIINCGQHHFRSETESTLPCPYVKISIPSHLSVHPINLSPVVNPAVKLRRKVYSKTLALWRGHGHVPYADVSRLRGRKYIYLPCQPDL